MALLALWTPHKVDIYPIWFEVVLAASGPLKRVSEVSTDAPFHCGSNDIIDGRRYLCRHKSLSPMTTTPAITYFPGVVDSGKK